MVSREAARVAGVGQTTVYFESAFRLDLAVLRSTLEAAGLEFDDNGHGVRMREGK